MLSSDCFLIILAEKTLLIRAAAHDIVAYRLDEAVVKLSDN